MTNTLNALSVYADGGVIGHNPSGIGGTYAYRVVNAAGEVVFERAGVITCAEMGFPYVTNNQTELLAILYGLNHVGSEFAGTVYSDSGVSLGRLFEGWKWSNIPAWMHKIFQLERNRLVNWSQITHVLLDGHPTAAQLAAGIGKRGHPVSEHNVWCDKACQAAAQAWLDEVLAKEQVTV